MIRAKNEQIQTRPLEEVNNCKKIKEKNQNLNQNCHAYHTKSNRLISAETKSNQELGMVNRANGCVAQRISFRHNDLKRNSKYEENKTKDVGNISKL